MEDDPAGPRRAYRRLDAAGRPGEASVGELSFGLFVLALVAFSPALLAIFGEPVLVFGIPLLYVYIFSAWGVVIVLLARLAGRAGRMALSERDSPAEAPPAAPDEG
jgi:hypothetical protein